MKLRYLLSSMLLLLLLTNCKKNNWFDYRKKYTGNYSFTVNARFVDDITKLDSTYTFEFDGRIDLASQSAYVKIFFADDRIIEEKLYKTGIFETRDYGAAYFFKGEFDSKKSVSFINRLGSSYGGRIYTVTGKKKK